MGLKILTLNCSPDLTYFKEKGLIFGTTEKTITQYFPLKFLYKATSSDNTLVDLYTPDVAQYLEQYTGYDIIMVGWSPNDYGSEVSHTGGYTCPIQLKNGAFWATVRQDNPIVNNYALHEGMHLLGNIINIVLKDFKPKDVMDWTNVSGTEKPYYINDPFSTDLQSNYNQTWTNYKPFINRLNNLHIMNTYPNFNPVSDPLMVGLKIELMDKLQAARTIAGIPFKITSGLRSIAKNILVGGKSNSAHLIGEAVDLACSDASSRWIMLNALLKAGFNRLEIAKDHIHADISKTLPPNIIDFSNLA